MTKKETRPEQRRLASSYITTLLSITLVLFIMGIVGFLILNARSLSIQVKENIGINIELEEDLREADIQQLKKSMDAKIYVKSTEYVSKEQAAIETQKALGEDFLEFLGYNPLPATIKVKLHADYANPDSIENIEKELAVHTQIRDIYYKKTLLHEINDNVKKISLILSSFSFILLIISLSLINNTIRLSVYSKRFLIHTMQLVGATRGFIRKPFILKGAWHGLISALIATALLTLSIYLVQKQVTDIVTFIDADVMAVLFLIITVTGVLLSVISTFFAVNKYLNLEKDKLFY
jgi:cell division transport system permease protein